MKADIKKIKKLERLLYRNEIENKQFEHYSHLQKPVYVQIGGAVIPVESKY